MHKRIMSSLLCLIIIFSLLGLLFYIMLYQKEKLSIENIENSVYALNIDDTTGICLAVAKNYFITTAHIFSANKSESIIAENSKENLHLNIVKINYSKDLALLYSEVSVSKYVYLGANNLNNCKVPLICEYNNNGYRQQEIYINKDTKNLRTQTKELEVVILKGKVNKGASGAPVIYKGQIKGIISCINNINGDIYAVSLKEILKFTEDFI